DLVEVEQLLPGRGQILVGGEDRHQRAERQIALDDQIAAQRIEEERRQLPNEIVEEFGEEFAAVDLEPDVINHTQNAGKVGQMQLDRVVCLDLDDAAVRFLDPVGDLADGAHPLLAKLVHL